MKIGNRTVIISEMLFVPDGESAELEYKITDTDLLKIRLKLPQEAVDKEGEKNPFISVELNQDWFEISFANFTLSTGSSTREPFEFALSNNREPITLFASISKLKAATKIELQIMMEAKE